MKKINYRAEIDGLRAIAIIAVLLYHAEIDIFGFRIFSGGYLGVDIFFVISGYLISKIILNEYEQTGDFSFRNFYWRRIRRILPLFVFVSFLSLIFSYYFLLPEDFKKFAGSILASLFFLANQFFYLALTEYTASSSWYEPMLHSWSLSIEEQFYLFFPIIFIISLSFFRKYIMLLIFVFFGASLFYANSLSLADNQLGFYALKARIWELLFGVKLVFLERYFRHKQADLFSYLAVLGMILMILPLFLFTHKQIIPSFYSLIPLIGSGLIILFSRSNDIIFSLLVKPKIIFIGLISYSLYLWHYPILVFAKMILPNISLLQNIGLIFLIFIASVISYRFIEQPFRKQKIITNNLLLIYLISFYSLLIICSVYIFTSQGLVSRVPAKFQQGANFSFLAQLKNDSGKTCHNDIKHDCVYKALNKEKQKIVLLGDSHMGSIAYDLTMRLNEHNSILISSIDNCPLLQDSDVYFPDGSLHEKCSNEVQKNRFKQITEFAPDIIILFARYPIFVNDSLFDNAEGGVEINRAIATKAIGKDGQNNSNKAIKGAITSLLAENYKIILVYPLPETGWDIRKKLWQEAPKKEKEFKEYLATYPITTNHSVIQKRMKNTYALFSQIKSKNLHRIYLEELFCNKQLKTRCITNNLEDFYYYDDNHPSQAATKIINDLIIAKIKEISD